MILGSPFCFAHLVAMAEIVGAVSWVRVTLEYFNTVRIEEDFWQALCHFLPSSDLSNMSTEWNEYCISLMQLLPTQFPNFTTAITQSVDWISYEVARDAFWWIDLDDLNSCEDLMAEFNSIVKTFSTSVWVWHEVCDPWLFEQPPHHVT